MATTTILRTWTQSNEPGRTYAEVQIEFDENGVAGDVVTQVIIVPTPVINSAPEIYAEKYEDDLVAQEATGNG